METFMEQFGGYIIPVAVIIVVLVLVGISKSKQKKFKNEITAKIIKEMFPDADYRPDEYISRSEYEDMCFPIGTNFSGSDLLYATTKGGRKFRYSEIDTTTTIHSGKTTTTVTVFKGGIFSFEYPKKFSSPVFIHKKWSSNQSAIKTWGAHKIETENVSFNKKFVVNSEDDHTAFYICTPKFMDRLLDLSQIYKNGLMITFKDNWIHIAISYLDMFKAPIFGSRNPKKIAKFSNKSHEDLNRIDQFIEDLEIDSRMFR